MVDKKLSSFPEISASDIAKLVCLYLDENNAIKNGKVDFATLNALLVHKDGQEEITGNKTFSGDNVFSGNVTFNNDINGTAAQATADVDGNAIKTTYAKLDGANCKSFSVYNNSFIKGTAPSSDSWWGINFYDKNGTNNANNRLARFQHCYYQNGNAVAAITVDKPEAGSTSNVAIVIHYDANGDTYATFPTPPSATDNSTKGATTEWVRNHRCTTKATTTSSASADAPAYIVQNYKSGKSWYRVWSDGWIEQGGYYSGSGNNKEVTLLKTMTDTNYSIMLNGKDTSGAAYSGCASATSTSKISISIPSAYDGAWWRVSGY